MRLFALLGIALGCGAASAQSPSLEALCNPASNPLDAVRAAPNSHHVIFEDDHVRILQVILPPLAIEPVHIHALPSVISGDTGGGAGAKFLYTTYNYENGKMVEVEKEEVTPTPGYRAVWTGPEGLHAISNISGVGVEYLRTEIKPEACARAGAPRSTPDVKPPA